MQDLHLKKLIGMGKEHDGLYWLVLVENVKSVLEVSTNKEKLALAVSTSPETWHRRLGHASKEKLQHF